MKVRSRAAALAGAALFATCLGMAQVAEAGTVVLNQNFRTSPTYSTNLGYSGSGGGGEFGVSSITGYTAPTMGTGVQTKDGSGNTNVFDTFCLEYNETVSLGTTYQYEISTGAVMGGVSGGNPDPICNGTAYLYSQFWAGTLSGYTYTTGQGRMDSSTALQQAIWAFEGEISTASMSSTAASFYNAAVTALGGSSAALAENNIGNVRVMNLYLLTTDSQGNVIRTNYQSQLIMVPLPPAAWLGLTLMGAMGVVGLIRRRRNSEALV